MNKKDKDFWDIDFLLPPKKKLAVFSNDVSAVEIDVETDETKISGSAIPNKIEYSSISQSSSKKEHICRYTPSNPLIKSVDISKWPTKYTFYEHFKSDAIKFFHLKGEECQYVPFFSYMPQYMQLSHEQKAYYLWWRENVRNSIRLETDYSYIYLYIYEIINLPDFISPVQGLELLCNLWVAYREDFPKLDRNMTEWICDYCLINLLEPPFEKIMPFLGIVKENSSFFEFYTQVSEDSFYDTLFNLGSSYNWRQSKFRTAETAEIFDRHMPAAFRCAIDVISERDIRFSDNGKLLTPAKLSRDAYPGALCSYNVKRRIDIEYFSFTRSPEVRMIITDIIKCSENLDFTPIMARI